MKCPNCKYEYEGKWDRDKQKEIIIKGKNDFPTLDFSNEIEHTFRDDCTAYINICPECGILFINDIKYWMDD